jgi:DNA-binding MarR family transcriptional regulator
MSGNPVVAAKKGHALEYLFDEVLRTAGRLVAATPTSAGGGLTGSQNLVLTAVVRAERPPTVPQIARSLGHSRQAVQRLADVLVDRGLVETVDNPDHKRARRLVPTSTGRTAYREADLLSRTWARRVTHDLSDEQLATAVETLRALRHNIEIDAANQAALTA